MTFKYLGPGSGKRHESENESEVIRYGMNQLLVLVLKAVQKRGQRLSFVMEQGFMSYLRLIILLL